MPKKYLELDSNYRNRNLFPKQSCFDVAISQSGMNSQSYAFDPITDAYPIISFKISDETVSGATGATGYGSTYGNTGACLSTSSVTKFLYSIYGLSNTSNLLQQNYFVGAVMYSTLSTQVASRIQEWTYVTTIPGTTIPETLSQTVFSVLVDVPIPSQYVNNPTQLYIGQMSNITGSPQQIFIPTLANIPNVYNNYYIYNQTGSSYTQISNFDRDTHLAVAGSVVSGWNQTDVLVLRKTLPTSFVGGYTLKNGSTSIPTIGNYNICSLIQGSTGIITNTSYINSFIKYYPNINDIPITTTRIIGIVLKLVSKGITTYIVDTTGSQYNTYISNPIYTVSFTEFIATAQLIPLNSILEILQFTKDNFSPFIYNGSLTSQNQPVSYDIMLNSLTLPNVVLSTGGRIAYYPYVYVEIENRGSSSSNINTIYSNNPNTYKAVFKVPITDLNHPLTTPFVKLTGNNIVQTIPFKINCDMHVNIKLPDGTFFETQQSDNPPGQTPNPMLQISIVFEVNRV